MLREYYVSCGICIQVSFGKAASIVFQITMMFSGFMLGVPRKPSQCGNVVLHNGRSLIPGFLLLFRMVCYDVSRYIKMYYTSLTATGSSYISVCNVTTVIFQNCYVSVECGSVFQCLQCEMFCCKVEFCIPLANNGCPQRCQALKDRSGWRPPLWWPGGAELLLSGVYRLVILYRNPTIALSYELCLMVHGSWNMDMDPLLNVNRA
jgi:hypothetical protein